MRRVLLAAVAALVFVPVAHGWTWPAEGPVLRQFALGDNPYAGGQHRGIDVGGELGADVRAPAAGTVSFAGTVPGGGKTVTIQTADGYAVTLLQLGETLAVRGSVVEEGAVVGRIGPSGDAVTLEPHVHLGVRVAADEHGYLDPLTLLPPRVVPPPTPETEPVSEPVAQEPVVVEQQAEAPVAEAPPVEVAVEVPVVTLPEDLVIVSTGPSVAVPDQPVQVPRAVKAPEPRVVKSVARRRSTRPRAPAPAERARVKPVVPLEPAMFSPNTAVRAAQPHAARAGLTVPLAALMLALLAVAAAPLAVLGRRWGRPMMGADGGAEDPRSGGVAVCERPAAHRPRGGVRRPVRHLRALPPAEGQRRPDGQRDGRARDAGDGRRRPGRTLAA